MRAEVLRHPAFSGVPKQGDKIKSGYLTPAFSGAHIRAEVLRDPCVLSGSPSKGTKSKVATSPLPSRGPTKGRTCYVAPAFSGVPKQGDKIKSGDLTLAFSGAQMRAEVLCNYCVLACPHQGQKWPPHPCLLWGPHKGGSAT